MQNKEFINYLNTLHSMNASNQNAFTEENQNNIFFESTMVKRNVGDFIKNKLQNEAAHILVLTGHAGDGKTGLLLQILNDWNVLSGKKLERLGRFQIPNGSECTYIKDFSELSLEERSKIVQNSIDGLNDNRSTFLVANTGPLINTFKAFMDEEQTEKFVDMIDRNDGNVEVIGTIRIAVINIATIDNSSFVEPYLKKVLNVNLWKNCSSCPKKSFCPIFFNSECIRLRLVRVADFIKKHYIWQQAYMHKLTIRQIVAHLSYMITGGLKCEQIKNVENIKFTYLFSNLFFGFNGLKINKDSLKMKAINDTVVRAYGAKKLYADEELFIKRNFTSFNKEIGDMLINVGRKTCYNEDWQYAVRRAYIMQNIVSVDENLVLDKNVFSAWFNRYLDLKNKGKITSKDNEIIKDALSMIFLGTIEKKFDIPITFKRDNSVTQNVQIVIGDISKNKVKLVQENVKNFDGNDSCRLTLSINGEKIEAEITLPMINYFDDIRKGAITTDIDPLLSQGVDSIKAQIMEIATDGQDCVRLSVLGKSQWDLIEADLVDNKWQIH